MSYIYIAAALAVAGLIWLIFKSRELTASQLKLHKDRKSARARMLRSVDASEPAALAQDTAYSRAKFGQR